ncbi:MAG: hypothetical protein DMG23_08460 [Acidobacteria bacterium]|nr:MAG: hypothetical protein DMG23_08460 [Acidobacteriota bacterium]
MARQLHGLKSFPNFDAGRRCKRLYCSLTFTCLFWSLSRPALLADEYARVSRHSARLFSYGTLILDTRVGDIRIEGWDEPRLEVEAETVVRASSEKKAQRLYDRVKIQIEGGDKEVRVRTVYPPRRFWRPFRAESKLSVNFRIKMPFDANLVLTCVDGDVRVRGIVGEERLRVNYGDVEIDVPSVYRLRSLKARTWVGYVQSDLHGEENAGLRPRLTFWNPSGSQDITVQVRLGGVFVYSAQD